ESRESDAGGCIRRRRGCLTGDRRFTTYERPDLQFPTVVKRSGLRAEFDREKLRGSIALALRKRPVAAADVDAAVQRIEEWLRGLGVREVASERIGETVMAELRKLDKVGYVRFASVYRSFEDVNDFADAIREIRPQKPRNRCRRESAAGDLVEAAPGRDHLRIDRQLDQGGALVPPDEPQGLLARRPELGGSLEPGPEAAECFGIAGEIRVGQAGTEGPPGVVTLLVHADRAVHPVVEHQDEEADVVLGGGGELARAHEEVAVTGEAHHVAPWLGDARGNRGRDPVAHRARGWRELRAQAAVAPEAMGPGREIAGAVGDDGVC